MKTLKMLALLSFVIIVISDKNKIAVCWWDLCAQCWFMICNEIQSVSAQLPLSRNLHDREWQKSSFLGKVPNWLSNIICIQVTLYRLSSCIYICRNTHTHVTAIKEVETISLREIREHAEKVREGRQGRKWCDYILISRTIYKKKSLRSC